MVLPHPRDEILYARSSYFYINMFIIYPFLRKPICDIVFCGMPFRFRCLNFLLSYFEFLVMCSVYDVVQKAQFTR